MKKKMKAAVLKQYNEFEWIDVPLPEIGDDQVLVKTSYASICGTDQHVFTGEFHPRTSVPFVPGHEFTGRIVAVGKSVTTLKEDDRVVVDPIIWCGNCAACKIGHYPACTNLKLVGIDLNGGFSEYVALNENQIYKIGDTISDQDAALVEVLSIGFHACARAGLKKDNTAVIWGTGKIGHCILQAARTITQNTVFLIDRFENRLKIARDHFDNVETINIHEADPVRIILEKTADRGVDVAFEAVGHFEPVHGKPEPVQGCIDSIRGAGTVCVLGLSDEPASIYMKQLIWREARIVASRVSHGEFKETIEYLAQGRLKPEILISKILPAHRAQYAFQLLEEQPSDHLKILLQIGEY